MSAQPPQLTVIAGPTASGKTALAIAVARLLDAEIVSADSQQVYRHFDIGTAKPSAAELAALPHHLVSVVEPFEDFSAARFQVLADAAIAELHARGRRVVVAGGTGLYLRVLLHGVVDAPPADPALRARLERQADTEGEQALWEALRAVDPESAGRLPAADRVRVIRALEIHTLTGQAASARRAQHGFGAQRYPATLWVLNPPREALYRDIDARTRAMYAAGLVEETRALVDRGLSDTAPMRMVGYAEALGVVRGALALEAAIALTAQRTRNFAKRQFTWFKKEPGARLLAPPWDAALIAGRT